MWFHKTQKIICIVETLFYVEDYYVLIIYICNPYLDISERIFFTNIIQKVSKNFIYFENISRINDRIICSILVDLEIRGAHTTHVPTHVWEAHGTNAGLCVSQFDLIITNYIMCSTDISKILIECKLLTYEDDIEHTRSRYMAD